MEYYTGQLRNYPYTITIHRNHHKKAETKVTARIENVFALDLEVTSAWIDESGEIIPYRPGEPAEYWNSLTPLALPYIWQLSVDHRVFYGRELSELRAALCDIPASAVCYIHNAAYDWHFLCNIFTWKTVFARSPHKPIKAVPAEAPHIEFRCSYMLTRLSLEAWGKSLGVNKLVGLLDYDSKIRTPLTELTADEMAYSEQDCLVINAGIKKYIEQYGSVWNIPLTQTGTVRRVIKKKLLDNAEYAKHVKTLVPQDARQYKLFQQVFAGGYTHGNYWYAGEVIRMRTRHKDFTSHYPTQMFCRKFPDTPFVFVASRKIPDVSVFDEWAYIMVLEFTGIESISQNTYIQASKADATGAKYDNGRVISAKTLKIAITEQDYLTIRNNYKWESVEVIEMWRSRKAYLPFELALYIIELYENKTTLKGVEGQEDLYAQAKQYINSLFGMACTSVIFGDVHYQEGGRWYIDELTTEMVNEMLNKLRSWKKGEKRYFIYYCVGVWVAAYARRALWECMESCVNAAGESDVLYCDTDSIFYIGEHDFSWYDSKVIADIKKACDHYGIDAERTNPADKHGKRHQMGVFSDEPECKEFVFLGAKRYCERRLDDKLYLTVSGINKGAVDCLNNDIRNFRDGCIFDKDNPSVRKLLHTYLTDMPAVTYPDGYKSELKYGINMRKNGYELSITDEYKELTKLAEMTINDIPETFTNSLRGHFKLSDEYEEIL